MTSKRLLAGFTILVLLLMAAGAVSFVRYVRRHAPDPQLVAVSPFDVLVPGLEPWRVRLATDLTRQLDSAPFHAVPQAVIRERWQGQARPELAALEVARRTSAGIAIYGRLDPVAARRDSVRVRVLVLDATAARVVVAIDRSWPVAGLGVLGRALAEQVRRDYR